MKNLCSYAIGLLSTGMYVIVRMPKAWAQGGVRMSAREFDWRWRCAMQIATMLPEEPADAEIVVGYVSALSRLMERRTVGDDAVIPFDLAAASLRPRS